MTGMLMKSSISLRIFQSGKTSHFLAPTRLHSRWHHSFSKHATSCKCKRFLTLNNQYFNQLNLYISCRGFAAIPPIRSGGPPSGSPISWLTVGVTVVIGSVMIFFLKKLSHDKEKEFEQNMIRSYGRPELGGDFELVDHNGLLRSNRDFLGKWILIYFGFTHCPDICPEELEKMGYVIDNVNRNFKSKILHPVFISIDPERDTPAAVKKYIADFHPDMIGLTGTREQVDAASRAFRVYYSAGPRDEESDYLVDHSVIMYLLDEDGEFCQYYGQNKSAGEMSSSVTASIFKKRNTSTQNKT